MWHFLAFEITWIAIQSGKTLTSAHVSQVSLTNKLNGLLLIKKIFFLVDQDLYDL
jgi:type I site-specific restriction-modification system R (restriction) subunit